MILYTLSECLSIKKENYYSTNFNSRLLNNSKKKDITFSFFDSEFLFDIYIYRSDRKRKCLNSYSTFNILDILLLIIESIVKKNIFNFTFKTFLQLSLIYSRSWFQSFKILKFFLKSENKNILMIKKQKSDFYFFCIYYNYIRIQKNLINNRIISNLEKKSGLLLGENSKICNLFFKFISNNQFKKIIYVREILNKISTDNIHNIYLYSLLLVPISFIHRIFILEIFEKIKNDFINFGLYSKICSIIFKNLFVYKSIFSFVLLFMNFQHKENFDKLSNIERFFRNESVNESFFKNFFFKKSQKFDVSSWKKQFFIKIEFFFLNSHKNIVYWFSHFYLLKYTLLVLNSTTKILKSFWIEVCYKILEKKNKIIDKTLKYKKIFFNFY